MRESEGMDALSAHLDRGWALVAAKDYGRARLSARAVLDRDPGHPEGLTLLGLAELGEGDLEAALEAFDTARDVDPDYLAPVLYGAEALAGDPERIPEALARLEQAYGLVEPGSPELVDTLLLHVDLLLGEGRRAEALARLAQLDPQLVGELDQRIQLARLVLRLDETDLAARLLEPLADAPGLPSEGLYALAQLAERQGDYPRAFQRYLQVREVEAARLGQQRLPTVEEVEALAREAILRLPAALRAMVETAELRVRDLPAEELVADGLDPWMPLLVTGPPLPTDALPAGPRAFHVFLYRANFRFETMDSEARIALVTEHLQESLERFGE